MKSIVGASLLVLLFAVACVRGKRVIRAAEHAEKTGLFIVKLHSETSNEIFEETRENARMLSDDSTVYVENKGVFKFFAMNFPEESLDEVKELQNVEYIAEDTVVHTYRYETDSWALDRIDQRGGDLDGIYDPGPGRDGEGVDIYILDTGIRYDHSEFGGRAHYPGFDPVDDYHDLLDEDCFTYRQGADCHGHGTAVASLVNGRRLGVAKQATVYSVRVLDCYDNSSWSIVIDGIDRAVDAAKNSSRPSVISMSLGYLPHLPVNDAVEAATNAGVPVVVAAGNEFSDACYYSPGSAPSAITVGATDRGDRAAFFSNGGSCVDILAPGKDVQVADFHSVNGTLVGSGTSISAPIVSGVLAIYLQERPTLDVQDLTELLIDRSVKGILDLSTLFGFGLNETTPNRLVQVRNAAPPATSTPTITSISTTTNTVTASSTIRVTETPLPSPIHSTHTRLVTQTVVATNTITKTSIQSIPTTMTVTPTPTPAFVDEGECNISSSIDNLKKELIATVEDIMQAGIYLMAEIVKGGNTTTIDNFRVGEIESIPAQSCKEIATTKPFLESGDYWVKHPNGSTVLVHCMMEEIKGRKGMMTVAEMDMSQPDSECPGELHLRTEPIKMCERATNDVGCSSANFSTKGFPYQTVCGRVHGIQYGSPNAFYWYVTNTHFTINDVYVDGAILSRVNSTGARSHVWTFTAALDELVRPDHAFACPCTNTDATTAFSIPDFVGDDYFCETGSKQGFQYDHYYTEDPLWDGQGCGPKSTCCSHGNYFCKTFETATTDDIELRLCGNEDRSNEDSPITLLELYVQ